MGMYILKAGTPIEVYAPFGIVNGPNGVCQNETYYYDTKPWQGHVARKDTVLDKEQVCDAVAVANDREDIPSWAAGHIMHRGFTVFWTENAKGERVFAMVKARVNEPGGLVYG